MRIVYRNSAIGVRLQYLDATLETEFMRTYEIDPIHDPAWLELIEKHPRSSVFHTPAWLSALGQTYGYESAALTTSPSGCELTNGVVFCRVSSWLTGRRIVSVPFSDHCEPLVDDWNQLGCILKDLRRQWRTDKWKYVEIRPVHSEGAAFSDLSQSQSFCAHRLSLDPGIEEIHHRLHPDCVRRKIQRAQREKLEYEAGSSESLLAKFYFLLISARRHQKLPPQPLAWFRNLIACMRNLLTIRVASRNGEPISAILTLAHKDTLVFKYGCSDRRFNKLGGTQMLLWNAICDAKKCCLREFDMGRSDWTNPGLIKFKDRWGAARSTLTYWRYGEPPATVGDQKWSTRIAGHIFGHLPDSALTRTGTLLYRHFG